MTAPHTWYPDENRISNSNIHRMMQSQGFDTYSDFWKWSTAHKEDFWSETLEQLGIQLHKKYDTFLDLSKGEEQALWLKGASMNIVDSCFQRQDDSPVLVYQEEGGSPVWLNQQELLSRVDQVAFGLRAHGLQPKDRIAIDMPMTLEAVCIYLGAVKAGLAVVTIADSFSGEEIRVRLGITEPKMIFTQDVIERSGKTLPLYEKVLQADPPTAVVVETQYPSATRRDGDISFKDFLQKGLSDDRAMPPFESVKSDPDETVTVLFSSGTTGAPKAIPWTHVTPIKGASDGYYHHDIQLGDVVCWPTNLGWMMGPWLIFATLINKGCLALYYGAPMGSDFGKFVEKAGVNMLGVVPSLVRQWKATSCMESSDWKQIKCFSSTGEASNPDEMSYLMKLAGDKPVIEYCGGTEIGGGYVTGTVVQANIPSTFSTQALGGAFVLMDDEGQPAEQGELFIVPPVPGLSNRLLNRDHHEVYFKGTPSHNGIRLRRHGDELVRLENGYYRAMGRSDDAMNLGGIKVSSIQIEELVNQLDFVKESAAIAVSPPEGGPAELIVFGVIDAGGTGKEASDSERLRIVRQQVKVKLNPLFKVQDFVEVELLPRTASGKVMRRSLRDQYSEERKGGPG